MKILLVDHDDDDALRSFLSKELEQRGYDVHQSFSGDGAFHVWQREGPWEFVLTDYRFVPGTKIKDGVQLVTAIHGINPRQRMAIMTAERNEAREKLPRNLRALPILRKHFRLEQLLSLLQEPVLPPD
jgi:DNA-binding NtrC family response regulator